MPYLITKETLFCLTFAYNDSKWTFVCFRSEDLGFGVKGNMVEARLPKL